MAHVSEIFLFVTGRKGKPSHFGNISDMVIREDYNVGREKTLLINTVDQLHAFISVCCVE